jgi:hypothetical protein
VAELLAAYKGNTSTARANAMLFRLAVYENWARLFVARKPTLEFAEALTGR